MDFFVLEYNYLGFLNKNGGEHLDKTSEFNESIEALLKEIHVLKKARTETYGLFQSNDLNILKCIEKHEKKHKNPPTALILSKYLGITQATITPMVDRMVKNHQVERVVSPTDKRAKLLTMTEEGQQTLAQSNQKERQQMEKLISYLGEEDTGECIRLLQKITRFLEQNED